MAKSKGEIKALISQMTLKEKIGQLIQLNANFFTSSIAGVTGPCERLGIEEAALKNIGSVLNFHGADEMIKIQKKHLEEDRNKIPMLFMMDVIHGYRTIYPIPLAMGASFDPEMLAKCCKMAAKEASAGGIHLTFAPMMDYVRDARWGRVMETCGEDPYLNSVMGAAQVRAFQGDDLSDTDSIASCVKHFAAYGGAEAGRDYNTVEISERLLREYYLPAYKACIDAGTTMLMPSFNSLSGVPSVANEWLMKTVLKDEWGFDGVVISDYGAVEELRAHGITDSKKEAAALAFDCGCDIEMMSVNYYNHLEELVAEGRISEDKVDAAVERVLELKNALGLFDDPYRGTSPEKQNKTCLTKEHRDIAREAAKASAVLLKNDGTLPLSRDTEKIALIGPFAKTNALKGFWACDGRDEDCVSVYDGVRALLPDAQITVALGCEAKWDDRDTGALAEAVCAAREADAVILCLGEPQDYSGEGNSRIDIDLPGMQNVLAALCVEANKNTAALVFSGRPLALTELDKVCPAILHMWFPGSEGGSAAAELLFGLANPSGKLSMSFPRAVGQCPIYYNHPSTGRAKPTTDDKHIAYTSSYIGCANPPLYPFGHGLSYTSFEYKAMELDTHTLTNEGAITVKVRVQNTGEMDGAEVVQLYIHDLFASTVRPIQQLAAFEKVYIPAGQSREVEFKITEPMLRFYDAKCNCVSEAGEFDVFVGHADNPYITDRFTLK